MVNIINKDTFSKNSFSFNKRSSYTVMYDSIFYQIKYDTLTHYYYLTCLGLRLETLYPFKTFMELKNTIKGLIDNDYYKGVLLEFKSNLELSEVFFYHSKHGFSRTIEFIKNYKKPKKDNSIRKLIL